MTTEADISTQARAMLLHEVKHLRETLAQTQSTIAGSGRDAASNAVTTAASNGETA